LVKKKMTLLQKERDDTSHSNNNNRTVCAALYNIVVVPFCRVDECVVWREDESTKVRSAPFCNGLNVRPLKPHSYILGVH